MVKKRSGMGGRGIQAMLGAKQKSDNSQNEQRVDRVAIRQLQPGQYQPRKTFDEAALQELADSIQAQGLVQPIVVREIEEDKYEIIAGERRWRACKLAGLEKVPVIIRNVNSQETLAMALIENIQREDLNPIETALGLRRLLEEFELTQQAVADAVGRSRSAVSNMLRLLKLPQSIQDALHDGKISMGHARCVINFPDEIQAELIELAIENAWSVRQIEQAAQKRLQQPEDKEKSANHLSDEQESYIQTQQQHLADLIGSKVKIQHKVDGKGKIEIRYQDQNELLKILNYLKS